MKKLVLLVLVSSFVMSGWTQDDKENEKAEKAEAQRLCKVYKIKVKHYKETMRDDEMAQATLNNYIRLQTKYCNSADDNSSE